MELNGVDRCLWCMEGKDGSDVCPHCGCNERESTRLPPYLDQGTWLADRYVIGRLLGHGGFGITYLAWDTEFGHRVAIKEYLPRDFATRAANGLSASCFSDETREWFTYGKQKFLDEAVKLRRFIDHPGIVDVLDRFDANGTAYMVMHYVDGKDLKEHLAEAGGKLPCQLALGILFPVLDALRAVHGEGLLHRDVAPDNIYVTREGRIKILDFGAARDVISSHSQTQMYVRKPGYSPEEQYRSKGDQGPWTDVYGAAATLYRMLTGERPPAAPDRLTDDPLQPPSQLGVEIGPQLEAVLMKALAVRAKDRYQTIQEFQKALQSAIAAEQRPPKPDEKRLYESSAGPQDDQHKKRTVSRRLVLAALVVALLVSAGWAAFEVFIVERNGPVGPVAINSQAEQARPAWEEPLARLEEERQERQAQEEQARREREAQARQEQLERERLAQEEVARLAPQCRDGRLNATQIRQLVTDKTAFGERIDVKRRYKWKEYQGSSGQAYFQKITSLGYDTGKWKLEGDTICWCYGTCEEYKCKFVYAEGGCSTWYYVDEYGTRTGRVDRWEKGDHTG